MYNIPALDYKQIEMDSLAISDVRERTEEEKAQISKEIEALFSASKDLSPNTLIHRLYQYIKKDCISYYQEDIPFQYDYILMNNFIWKNIEKNTKDNDSLWEEMKDIIFFFNLKLEEQKVAAAYHLFEKGLLKFDNIVKRYWNLRSQTCFASAPEYLDEIYRNTLQDRCFESLKSMANHFIN